MSEEEPVDWGPSCDEDAAAELIGKLALIGLTQFDASGTVVKKWQLHGRIIEARKGKGIVAAFEGVPFEKRGRKPIRLAQPRR
jgi:hypothetical protein